MDVGIVWGDAVKSTFPVPAIVATGIDVGTVTGFAVKGAEPVAVTAAV